MNLNIYKLSTIILTAIIISLGLYSCSDNASNDYNIVQSDAKNQGTNQILKVSSEEAVILQNVAYGEDPRQIMDIYLQPNRTIETPLIILVHGGAWTTGDKEDANFMRDACYANGINVVNINYRLTGENSAIRYTDMMQDIDRAIALILAHADEYNVRKSKIVMWGGSAGGHLSLLYAYNYDSHNVISLVMTLGAPTRFDSIEILQSYDPAAVGALIALTGKPIDPTKPLDPAYADASPYYGENLKPTLLIHGDQDMVVNINQAAMMSQRLTEANIENIAHVLVNGGHAGENATKESVDQANILMYQAIMKYSY